MKVKFTNTQACLQNVYQNGQLIASLRPGASFTTSDADLIDRLQAQTDMDAEEVAASAEEGVQAPEDDAAAADKPAAKSKKK